MTKKPQASPQSSSVLFHGKNREVNVEIMSTGDLRLTWESPGQRMGQKQSLLNREIFQRYTDTPREWLLFLNSLKKYSMPMKPPWK